MSVPESPQKKRSSVARVLAVMSGKGGVGKSTIAGMLASSLRWRNYKIGLLDADFTRPSTPKLFGIHRAPEVDASGIRPVISRTGVKLISINLLLADKNQPAIWRGPLIRRAIEQFWRDIKWGDIDYLIVDLPSGTSDAACTVMKSLPVDSTVLVTSPQDRAGLVVHRAGTMAKQMGAPLVGLVENMSHRVCTHCGNRMDLFGASPIQSTAQRTGAPILGRMPLDTQLAAMCDRGEIEAYYGVEFEDIADKIVKIMEDPIVQHSSRSENLSRIEHW